MHLSIYVFREPVAVQLPRPDRQPGSAAFASRPGDDFSPRRTSIGNHVQRWNEVCVHREHNADVVVTEKTHDGEVQTQCHVDAFLLWPFGTSWVAAWIPEWAGDKVDTWIAPPYDGLALQCGVPHRLKSGGRFAAIDAHLPQLAI
jgi:hypothetical protein